MSKIINIIHNNDKESITTAEILKEKLSNNDFIVSQSYCHEAMLNICIGGDGAFLRAVHNYDFPDIPFTGINTGHLGFFQELSPENIDFLISRLKSKKYSIKEINLVEGSICTKTSCSELLGVNEFTVKGIESKVIHLNVFINNNHLERFSGDGIIISTPTGSTAYNFSAGGSIIYPTLKTLQITPLAPISSKAYRSLLNSIIVPKTITIKVKPEYRYENSIIIIADGIQHQFDNIVEINFKLSDLTISRLTLDSSFYWNNLKSKFL